MKNVLHLIADDLDHADEPVLGTEVSEYLSRVAAFEAYCAEREEE